jgi:hypothetical protein
MVVFPKCSSEAAKWHNNKDAKPVSFNRLTAETAGEPKAEG